jgi:hypothetical protein
MAIDPNPLRNRIKIILTTAALTIASLAASEKVWGPLIPTWLLADLDKGIGLAEHLAVLAGVLGASPLGRLIWKGDGPDLSPLTQANHTPSGTDVVITQSLKKPPTEGSKS